ncbi:response regulator transcription factor [Dyadobacter bucti]|uniref:response regulator transcription factor n=1 Tax=Dyadobacter bucti TaxID=2572203 RepID=UPI0011096B6D|nr:response regulator transcription factor [Dyadobacter bucti]
MELISDIRFVSGRTPLLLYGRLLQMEDVALDLLKLGINGFLSIDASADEHFVAIDAVMRGDTYMDSRLKAHVVTALLPRSHRTG